MFSNEYTFSRQSRSILGLALGCSRVAVIIVHYDSCAVLHKDTLPCVCSLVTKAAAADQDSDIFDRPPSTSLQQHVRCEMGILRVPVPPGISGPLLPLDLREAVFATQWPRIHNHTSIVSLGGRCVGLPHDAVGSQQMVFQRHIFWGRACEDRPGQLQGQLRSSRPAQSWRDDDVGVRFPAQRNNAPLLLMPAPG